MIHDSEFSVRATARITRTAMVVTAGIHALVILDDHRTPGVLAAILTTIAVLCAVNPLLTRLEAHGSVERVENARMVANMAGLIFIAHLTRWCDPNWLWLPFFALVVEGTPLGCMLRLGGACLAMTGLGLLEGTDWRVPAAAATLSWLCFIISSSRRAITHDALEHLAVKNRELDRALREVQALHARALKTERLASLGMLAAGVAHEINNPMSFVTANLSSLAEDLREAKNLSPELVEQRDEVLPATLDGVKRVNRIVADLRRFARGDPEAFTEFDLNGELGAACRIAKGKFGPDCRLEVCLGELPPILGHPQQIAQIAVNLLVNAAQALKGGGTVRLESRADGDGVEFAVADDGAGMDESVKAHLFEPFFTTKAPGEGTGLGLAVIYGLVKAHGGTIDVESAPGKGSRFRVRLPLAPPVPCSGAVAAQGQWMGTPSQSLVNVVHEDVNASAGQP